MTDYRVRGLHLYQPKSDGTDVHTFDDTTTLWSWLGNQIMVGDTVKVLKPVDEEPPLNYSGLDRSFDSWAGMGNA